MTALNMAVINASTVLTDEQVKAALPAMQTQLDRDVFPIFGWTMGLEFYSHADAVAGKIPKGTRWHTIADNSDAAGALGYHEMTPDGLPVGYTFAVDDAKYGLSWTVTVTHELIETGGDPWINLVVEVGNRLYAYELCDACEDDQFAYEIDGVRVTDFVFPAWFQPGAKGRFDFCGKIAKPLELLSGGYISEKIEGHDWTQLTAEPVPMNRAARRVAHPVGSRRHRRTKPRADWRQSALLP